MEVETFIEINILGLYFLIQTKSSIPFTQSSFHGSSGLLKIIFIVNIGFITILHEGGKRDRKEEY